MPKYLVLVARHGHKNKGRKLRSRIDWYVDADGPLHALHKAIPVDRLADGQWRLGTDIRKGDRLWIAEVAGLRVVEPDTHRATLDPAAFEESPE